MKPHEQTLAKLSDLFDLLLNKRLLPKGSEWKDEWPGWDRGKTWHPEKPGVYILWETEIGLQGGRPPIYVGEGLLGPRIWESFKKRPGWNYAQLLTHDLISGDSLESQFWRKALERLCILILEPVQNRD